MKFIWKQLKELSGNKTILILTVLQFILSICCYQICYSLTNNYLSTGLFFSGNYNNNSVRIIARNLETYEAESILSCVKDTEGFYVNYYTCVLDEEKGEFISVGVYSDYAFNNLDLKVEGEMVDTTKDYGDAIPVVLSSTVGIDYEVGETIEVNGFPLYICGKLANNDLYYMSNGASTQHFIMAYDPDGIIEANFNKQYGDCIFITANTDSAFGEISNPSTFSGMATITSHEIFNWKDATKGQFQTVASFIIIGVWIMIMSTFSLLCSNYLSFKKNEKRYRSQLCVGAKKREILMYFVVRMVLCVLIATPLSSLAFKVLSHFIPQLVLNISTIYFGMAVSALITLVSVIAITIKLKRFELVSAVSN